MKVKVFCVSILLSLCVVLSLYKSPALADTTTNKLTLKTKSYTYNAKGQRISNKLIKKGSKVKFIDKIQKTNKVRNYYIFKNPLPNGVVNPIKENLYWLPYKKIKGKLYYKIATNKYIRCINVSEISGYKLYVPQATVTVTSPTKVNQKNIYAQNKDGLDTKQILKKGTKLVVDDIDWLEHNYSYSYHIKGTKLYIYSGNIVKKPKGSIYPIIMDNKNAFVLLNKNAQIYDSTGNAKSSNQVISKEVANIDTFLEADESKYIWQPQMNKAELFYHLVDNQDIFVHTLGLNKDELSEIYTKNDYIKAEDTNFIQGLKLKVTNTPEEAKAVYEANQN